jgi:hypothetical protein
VPCTDESEREMGWGEIFPPFLFIYHIRFVLS